MENRKKTFDSKAQVSEEWRIVGMQPTKPIPKEIKPEYIKPLAKEDFDIKNYTVNEFRDNIDVFENWQLEKFASEGKKTVSNEAKKELQKRLK